MNNRSNELKRNEPRRTLQNRLLLCFLCSALIPFVIIISYHVLHVQQISREQILNDNQSYLDHAMDEIQNQNEQVNEFTNWILNNQTILALMQREPELANQYDLQMDTAINEIQQQFSYRPVTQYIRSLFLVGNNGLDIRSGTEASFLSQDEIHTLLQMKNTSSIHWGGRINNPARITQESYVISYSFPFIDYQTGNQYGWLLILFSEDIFSKPCASMLDSMHNVWLCNDQGIVLFGQKQSESDILLTSQSLPTGWILYECIMESVIQQQRWILLRTIALFSLFVLLMIIINSLLLSQSLAVPVERMVLRVRKISNGEFPLVIYRDEANEMDYLENRILDMQNAIQELMDQQLKREKERQKLEIQVLQSQMNPHFLYNTLNTIRIMANMQGKKSIADMIDSLGKLLRANLSVHSDTISFRMELELLDCYMHIQNISQKGRLQWTYADVPEELMDQSVPKFLLQPLAENAILHGLTPEAEILEIVVSARQENNDLIMTVQDNGIGISQQNLQKLQEALNQQNTVQHQSRCGHGIALVNVQRRIQLRYGEPYGIVLESVEGRGCCVQIRLPYVEPCKQKEECE